MDPLRWILDTPEVWWPFQRDVLLHRSTPRRQRAFDLGSEFFAVKVRTIELFLSLSLLFNVIFCFLFDSFRLFVIIHGFCFLNSTERRYKATEVFKRIFCSFQFDSIHSRGILQFVYNRGGKWKIVFIECNSIPPVTVCACTFPLSYRGER